MSYVTKLVYTCTLIVHYHIIIPVISMATLSVCCGTCNEQYSKRESESVVVGLLGMSFLGLDKTVVRVNEEPGCRIHKSVSSQLVPQDCLNINSLR